MNEILHDYLYPVMLGSNTAAHACVRRMEKIYGIGSTVLTGKRALTLRFLPDVRVLYAPPTLSDDILMHMLFDLDVESGFRIPLLILCDNAYEEFFMRNRPEIEARFIVRRADTILGEQENAYS